MILIHAYNNLRCTVEGYKQLGELDKAKECSEVLQMIEKGTLKTKGQVLIEREKRGISPR